MNEHKPGLDLDALLREVAREHRDDPDIEFSPDVIIAYCAGELSDADAARVAAAAGRSRTLLERIARARREFSAARGDEPSGEHPGWTRIDERAVISLLDSGWHADSSDAHRFAPASTDSGIGPKFVEVEGSRVSLTPDLHHERLLVHVEGRTKGPISGALARVERVLVAGPSVLVAHAVTDEEGHADLGPLLRFPPAVGSSYYRLVIEGTSIE